MARSSTLSEADLITKVDEIIAENGGQATHSQLIDGLEARQLGHEAIRVIKIAQSGRIPVRVDPQPGSRAIVIYGGSAS